MSGSQPVHATLVARHTPGGWRGALLRGPSGAGKSSVALTLIGRSWRLVADDRVRVWRSGGRAWGCAPGALRGLLEVRGVGVMTFAALNFCEIVCVIDAPDGAAVVERTPAPVATLLCGVNLPVCTLDLSAPAAAEKVATFCGALRV